MAFSADTGMGECLVVARKLKEGGADPGEAVADSSTRATFVVLRVRPASKLSGYTIASQINSSLTSGTIRNLEDGPVGGTRLTFGDDVVGEVISSPLPVAGGWNPTRILDFALAQTAYQLGTLGRVWLPGQQQAASVDIPMTVVRQIGETGPYHSDIDGLVQSGASRGPFEHVDADDQEAATYPILWSHDAERERTMVFPGDSEGLIRLDATPEKVQRVWETRSHCHFNQNFRFTSQSTAMQFTPRPTLGGRAWISIKLSDEDREKTLVAWANTTLGLLLHWYHANKQQSGRGNIVSTALDDLPVLDVRKLDDGKIKAAVELFDELGKKVLMSADEIDQDAVRHELDRRFLGDVLGLPTLYFENNGVIDTLRKKLAREPSLTGRVPGSPKRAKKKSSAKAPSAKKTVCKNKKVKLEDLQNKELLVPPSLFDPQE